MITGQHRVTTTDVLVTDHKGSYYLGSGAGFTVVGQHTAISPDDMVDIERDGLLSGSMGGTISRFDFDTKTREA